MVSRRIVVPQIPWFWHSEIHCVHLVSRIVTEYICSLLFFSNQVVVICHSSYRKPIYPKTWQIKATNIYFLAVCLGMEFRINWWFWLSLSWVHNQGVCIHHWIMWGKISCEFTHIIAGRTQKICFQIHACGVFHGDISAQGSWLLENQPHKREHKRSPGSKPVIFHLNLTNEIWSCIPYSVRSESINLPYIQGEQVTQVFEYQGMGIIRGHLYGYLPHKHRFYE